MTSPLSETLGRAMPAYSSNQTDDLFFRSNMIQKNVIITEQEEEKRNPYLNVTSQRTSLKAKRGWLGLA